MRWKRERNSNQPKEREKHMNDLDIKRQRIEKLVKYSAVPIIGFFVAPFIFIAIKGAIGLLIAGAVGFIGVNMMPWFGAMVANWRLKAIKYEAAKNPIETLQNNYGERKRALQQFRDSINSFIGEVRTFGDKLEGYKNDYPQDATKFEEQYQNMRALLEQRKLKFADARASLDLYEKQIQRANAQWEMAQAAAQMNKAAGVDGSEFLTKIQTETAFDAVQKGLNSAFSDLELSLMDAKGNSPKALPQVVTSNPSMRPAIENHSEDPFSLDIDVVADSQHVMARRAH